MYAYDKDVMNIDNRPIGVFDSGLGGLTAVRKLMDVLPCEDIIYLGDTGRNPYGGRSRETLIKYTRQDMAFLLSHNIKAAVIACGTVSTNALDIVAGDYDIPVIGVVRPAVDSAVQMTRNRRIGLIGTEASIRSGTYTRLIHQRLPDAAVISQACPLFVPLVENGRIQPGDIVIETVAREYLTPVREQGVDTLILGCTHYPLISSVIAGVMGSGVKLISPGAETALDAASTLRRLGLETDRKTPGRYSYYVTDRVDGFEKTASLFLERSIAGSVTQVELDTL